MVRWLQKGRWNPRGCLVWEARWCKEQDPDGDQRCNDCPDSGRVHLGGDWGQEGCQKTRVLNEPELKKESSSEGGSNYEDQNRVTEVSALAGFWKSRNFINKPILKRMWYEDPFHKSVDCTNMPFPCLTLEVQINFLKEKKKNIG